MAGLKELRTRIGTIKSTQKITSAMKMVAAARLRRSQELLAKSAIYNDNLTTIAGRIIKSLKDQEQRFGITYLFPKIMKANPNPESYLLVVFTSDRGLCGSYNAYVIKETVVRINELKKAGKKVSVVCVGKKAGDSLKHRYPELLRDVKVGIAAKGADYHETEGLVAPVLKAYENNEFDVCELIYTKFHSAINREVVCEQFLPYTLDVSSERFDDMVGDAIYEYDAPKIKVLADILPLIIDSAAFQALVNSQASEHGARMTSMDNATRNASDMISHLTLRYNRIRQTAITTELVEIIAGAEAL